MAVSDFTGYNSVANFYNTFQKPSYLPPIQTGGNVPVPSPAKVPTVSPTPAPAPQSSGGGGSNGSLVDALISKGYNRTDAENAARGPNAAALEREYLGGGGGGGIDLDAAFRELDEAYAQSAAALELSRGNQLKRTQDIYDENQQQWTDYEAKVARQRAIDEQKIFDDKRVATRDIMQMARAAQQRTQALYGGYSSAGLAYSELANQDAIFNKGRLEAEYSRAYQQLLAQDADITSQLISAKRQLQKDRDDAERQIQEQFTTKLAELNMSKAANKTQARLSLLQDSINAARQIAASYAAIEAEYANWEKQQRFLIANQIQQVQSSYQAPAAFTKPQDVLGQQAAQTVKTALKYNPAYLKSNNEFSELENPFGLA